MLPSCMESCRSSRGLYPALSKESAWQCQYDAALLCTTTGMTATSRDPSFVKCKFRECNGVIYMPVTLPEVCLKSRQQGKQAVSIKSDINKAAVTLVENPVIQF